MTTAQADSEYRLLILGDGTIRTIPLTGTRWTVGRAMDCAIILRDPTVSRNHLLIERVGDTFSFRDLGGANPAQIDGRPIRQGTIRVGQQLSIGLTKLVLQARQRPEPVTTNQSGTVLISREVADDEAPPTNSPNSFPAAAVRILRGMEWTFADLGNLAHAAEPLVELALNLTNRETGWLARFPGNSKIETLAAISISGGNIKPQLSERNLIDARRVGRPHLLKTEESGVEHERLLIPLGEHSEVLLVLEDPSDGAPSGQELLQLAESLGKVVWHRMQETLERIRMRNELERLRFHGTAAHNALLTSTRLQSTREVARANATKNSTVLLIGEPGTEQEDLARYMHAESPRRANPFVCWDANSCTPEKQQVQILGGGGQLDLMQRAAGGTLLIEHPEVMPIELQREFARAIQDVSGDSPTRLVLASSTAPVDGDTWAAELKECIDNPPIHIPPLRDDTRDVLALAELFLTSLGTSVDGSPRLMSERCKRLLTQYSWPGNVRELRLTIESAAAKAGTQTITPRHLPQTLLDPDSHTAPSLPTLEDVERAHIAEVMTCTGGVRARAARVLGIASSTLYEKLKKYQID